MMEEKEEWIYCPICGGKTRLRLLQRTVLRDFPLFCPKCKRESIINAKNFIIEANIARR
nr:cysteine-rich KTR domain-containing protein [uncultured Oscillibacter sp.]